MTPLETRAPQPTDPDEALRQLLQRCASEDGAHGADALGRRVMADWRREMARSSGTPRRRRFGDASSFVHGHGGRRIGITALVAGAALLFVLLVKLHESPTQHLQQVDVLSQMSFGGL